MNLDENNDDKKEGEKILIKTIVNKKENDNKH